MDRDNHNLYFDNAATSWPKPEAVYLSAEKQMRNAIGNPGRSGHTRTLEADRLLYRAREMVSSLFNVKDPGRIIFALNATDALNIAIKGIVKTGDHVIHTAMDHNSVLRPLGKLKQENKITTTTIPCSEMGYPDLDFLEKSCQKNTRLLIVNHASNITGTIAPLKEMISIAHRKNISVLLDTAQSAGSLEIDAEALQVDIIAFTGHKSLLGPTGTGGLYVRKGLQLDSLREGGTGSHSEIDLHPEDMPERLEAGTMNNTGIAGLIEGLNFIQNKGVKNINAHEKKIRLYLIQKLLHLPGIKLHGPVDEEDCLPVISLTFSQLDCGELGFILESSYGILCRTGLHCAPLAHKTIGTFPEGTVRLSPGYFTTYDDINYLADALEEIVKLSGK